MTWIHPLFLGLGAAAIAVPVILHFLNRKPTAVVPLPTMILLQKAVEVRRRRSIWRDILLFLARVGFVVTVTCAAARPIMQSRSDAASTEVPIDHYILIDNSYSMLAEHQGITFLERAKNYAQILIEQMHLNDRAQVDRLIPRNQPSEALTNDRPRLRSNIANIEPAYEIGSFERRLATVLEAQPSPQRDRQIWVITDGTALPWSAFEMEPGRRKPETVNIVDVRGDHPVNNSGIAKAEILSDRNEKSDDVTILLHIDSNRSTSVSAQIELWKDNAWKPVDRLKVKTKQSDVVSRKVSLSRTDGPQTIGRIQTSKDDFRPDNTSYFVTPRHDVISIGLVNGDPRSDARDDAAHYLLSVLNATAKEQAQQRTYRTKQWTIDQLDEAPIENQDLLFLVDSADLSAKQVDRLKEFARNGGVLIIGAGPSYTNKLSSTNIQRLFPTTLRNIRTIPAHRPSSLRLSTNESEFQQLISTWGNILKTVRFDTFVILESPVASSVLLRQSDRFPMLFEWSFDKGSIYFWTTSFDIRWTNFPLTAGFPAFVHSLVQWSVRHKPFALARVAVRPAGSQLKMNPQSSILSIRDLRGDIISQARNRWLPAVPGIWNVDLLEDGTKKNLFVVTTADPKERDLTRLARNKLADAFSPLTIEWISPSTHRNLRTANFVHTRSSERGQLFAMLAFFFLFLESILAGRAFWNFRHSSWLFAFILAAGAAVPSQLFALGVRSQVTIARVEYNGGNSKPHARPLASLLKKIRTLSNIDSNDRTPSVRLSSPDVANYPFLYWAGDRSFPLPKPTDLQRLRRHLTAGGFILFDDALGARNKAFHHSVLELLRAVFPNSTLHRLKKDHSIFRSYYLLDRAWGRRINERNAYGLEIDGRTAVVYFGGDLAGALAKDITGQYLFAEDRSVRQRRMSMRFAVNLIMYTLTLDYKQDQIHIPFILNRRRTM